MKKRLRLVSVLLVVCLMTVLVSAALAGDDGFVAKTDLDKYTTVEEAFSAAEDGTTVTLLCDASLSGQLDITKSVTLDLNGCTLDLNGGYITASSADGVTVTNGKITNGGILNGDMFSWMFKQQTNAKLTLNEVTVLYGYTQLVVSVGEELALSDCAVPGDVSVEKGAVSMSGGSCSSLSLADGTSAAFANGAELGTINIGGSISFTLDPSVLVSDTSIISDPTALIDRAKQHIKEEDGVYTVSDHSLTDVPAKEATCTEAGWSAYQKCDCDYETAHDEYEALGHTYEIKYTWAEDECTATATCSVCAEGTDGNVVTETVEGSYVKDTDATCVTCEKGHYEVAFENKLFEAQSTEKDSVDKGDPLGHTYEIKYTWAEDKCTATATCSVCTEGTDGKVVTETVTASYVKDTDATCVTCEKGHYEVAFENKLFEAQSTEKDSVDKGDPLGHSYGDVDYTWEEDVCTAFRVCTNCDEETEGHVDSETKTGTYVMDTAATCTASEKGHYEVEFDNELFGQVSTGANTVDMENPLGHDYVNHEAKKPNCTEVGWEAYRTCSRCDYTEYVEISENGHSYESEVIAPTCTDKGYTIHICSVCQDTYRNTYVDELGHDLEHHDAKDPTCTSEGWKAYDTCTRCDYSTYEKLAMLDHEYVDPEFKWNEHECTATYTCVCGKTLDIPCTVTEEITKEPTCTVDGVMTYTATAVYKDEECSIFMTEAIPATGHKYDTPQFNWTSGYKCTGMMICKCGDSVPVACSVTSTIIKQPSCSAVGERSYTAKISYNGSSYYDSKTAEIDKLPHTEGGVTIENQVAPTCTEEGTYDEVRYCTECGTQISRIGRTTEPAGHFYVHHDAKAPTCTDIGWGEYESCANCDWDNRIIISEKGHNWSDEVTLPTCTERGYTTRTCLTCTEVKKTNYVDELGHDFAEPEFEWAADHSSAVAKVNCSRCGVNSFDCTITGNVAIAPTCTQKGSKTFVASVLINGELISDVQSEVIEATGHNYIPEVIAPTCTRGGYTIYNCSDCTASKTSDYVKATGHHYTNAVTKPTCVAQGYTTHTCTCGDTYVDSYTDALGHNYKNGVCTRCGDGTPTVVAPKVTASNVASSGKPRLTWAKVTGAAKYEIWRATSKTGTYKKTYTTTSLSYTNTGATTGTTYYYKVRAVTSDGVYSSYSSIVQRTCDCARPVVTISNNATSGKISLKWSAVTGAAKYEIWRATSKTGTYTKMYTTSSTSYTNTSAKAGSTYYYKVKAISSKTSSADSAYSEIVSRTCDCAKVTPKITTSSGHPKLTWSKVDGAAKYEIWRATSKTGTYTKMYTTSSTSYTNTSAKAGTTYYYKIKAISSKTSYANSAYSTPVSIKAK